MAKEKEPEIPDRHFDYARWTVNTEKGTPPVITLDFDSFGFAEHKRGHFEGTVRFLQNLKLVNGGVGNVFDYPEFPEAFMGGKQPEMKITLAGKRNISTLVSWLTNHNRDGRNDTFLAMLPGSSKGKGDNDPSPQIALPMDFALPLAEQQRQSHAGRVKARRADPPTKGKG